MHTKRSGFTLVEVLVAVVIFAFGVLSMAAFASLNYMYLRANQTKARLHVLNESMVEDLQTWAREPLNPAIPGIPTKFDSLFTYPPAAGDTIRKFIAPGSTTVAIVLFSSMVGATPSASDAKIYVTINSWAITGSRTIYETMNFALANYGMGE
jgi:prepilin-type N-terminal cleavage/methylation domain-containing protein